MTAPDAPLIAGADAGAAKAVFVFVHGRGQSPEEMRDHVVARLSLAEVAVVLPRAAGGVWYGARAIDPLVPEARAALAAALAQLGRDIARARADFPARPVMLAGFSQGACLALEYAFSGQDGAGQDGAGQDGLAALAALTGCRVGVESDGRPLAALGGLAVYLSGADADPWIPVAAFAEAAADLGRSGAALRADLFSGRAHEVSQAEIAMLQSMIDDLAAGQNPRMEAAR